MMNPSATMASPPPSQRRRLGISAPQKLAEMRDAVQAIVIPSSDVLSDQLQERMISGASWWM